TVTDSSGDFRPALHALWTLEGINGIDNKTLDAALRGPPPVVSAAVRLSERFLVNPAVLARVVGVAHAAQDPHVRVQCGFTLSAAFDPDARSAVARLLSRSPDDKVLRDAVMSGLAGQEFDVLDLLLADPSFAEKGAGHEATLAALAGAVLKEAQP